MHSNGKIRIKNNQIKNIWTMTTKNKNEEKKMNRKRQLKISQDRQLIKRSLKNL